MRLLHTSDWHLGRAMAGHSRREEQIEFLDWFVSLAAELSVDAVVIAGDIYDRTVPSEDSVRMLNDALIRLRRSCPVVLIPGNHDQAVRLGFAAELLATADVHIRYLREQSSVPVEVTGSDGVTVLIYGLPYLDPDLERTALGAARSHEDVLSKAMDPIRAHAAESGHRSVVVAHAFITGGQGSDSERDVRVGGVGDAPATVFQGVDYVALGHLHGAQTIPTGRGGPVVEYSGSPLAYSFSEQSHVKSVTLVDIPSSGTIEIERIATPVRYPLATLTGTLEDLVSSPAHALHVKSWVRIRYTDERAIANALGLVTARFQRVAEFAHTPVREGLVLDGPDPLSPERPDDPLEVLEAFLSYATGSAVRPEEADVLREVYEAVRDGGATT